MASILIIIALVGFVIILGVVWMFSTGPKDKKRKSNIIKLRRDK